MAKPIESLELHHTMIQLLIKIYNPPAVSNCSSEKKWPNGNIINMDELSILEFIIKQLFYPGLLDIK